MSERETSALVIRPASLADLPAVLALLDELAGVAHSDQSVPGAAEGVLGEILEDPRRELAVAESGGRIVGTADLLIVANLSWGCKPWGIIENVVVAGDVRRRGVARALFRHLIGLARTADCYKVQLLSGHHRTEAHAFYRDVGFNAQAEGFKIYADSPKWRDI